MKKKPVVASVEVIGETHLPADLLTPTLGSTYGLEGYEDMDYGSGVMYGGRGLAPVTQEAPAVPTGINRGASEHLVLDDLLKEASNLVEQSWLSEAVQDLERLPENPVDTIPELEELWGANRPTDGIRVYERDLKQAAYEEQDDEPTVKRANERDLAAFVARAMRRSAAGHPLADILRATYLDVGQHEVPRIRAAMKLVQAEHGLAGNVFVRHAAYPKYEQGKWTEHLRRTAKDARYLVVTPHVLKSATWVQDGRCTLTGRRVVTEVPWREAYAYYAPRLRDVGRRVASGDPREALRVAFLSLPEKRVATGENLPTHVTPSERVTSTEARTAFANAKVERKVYDPAPAHEARVRNALHRKLAGMAENHLLTPGDRDRLLASEAHPKEVLKAAAALAGAAKNGTYEGARMTVFAGLNRSTPVEEVEGAWRARAQNVLHRKLASMVENHLLTPGDRDRLLASEAHPKEVLKAAATLAGAAKNGTYEGARMTVFAGLNRSTPVEEVEGAWRASAQTKRASRVAAAVEKVKTAVEHGIRGAKLMGVIRRTIHPADARLAGKTLGPFLRETNALAEPVHTPSEYAGHKYAPHVAKRASVNVSPETLQAWRNRSVVGWVRRAMNEGFAGKDLDALVEKRFASDVLAVAQEAISAARRQHEGGAGFMYIEASAYATPDGVKGCEQGALKHRANQVKTLLAIPNKCDTCAHARTHENGTVRCALYNKVLVTREDFGATFDTMKQANIRSANMDDQEATASLFAPTYNEGEFNLHNASLDGFSLTAFPENDKVRDVAFGGLVINPEWE